MNAHKVFWGAVMGIGAAGCLAFQTAPLDAQAGLPDWVSQRPTPCEGDVAHPPGPSPVLHCIPLFPSQVGGGARGWAEILPGGGPFGVRVDVTGVALQPFLLRLKDLPDPAELGPYRTYVAWITSPTLHPWLRLGEVAEGLNLTGEAGLNQYMVMVTAEAQGDIEAPEGPIVLRGTSPSHRLQPHDLPFFLAELASALSAEGAAAGEAPEHQVRHHMEEQRVQASVHELHGREAQRAHARSVGEGAPAGGAWPMPPMHPAVSMPTAIMSLRPSVSPFWPGSLAGDAPQARPRESVRLNDGDFLHLQAGFVERTVGGHRFLAYGFNGQVPGPLLRARQGARVHVEVANRMDWPTAIHWHGLRLENRFDGVPGLTQAPIQPGDDFLYSLDLPDAGVFWYHPHLREDITQGLGLFGNLLVEPIPEDWYSPIHREEVLILDDILMGQDGPFPHGLEAPTHALMGRFGNVLLVNGVERWNSEAAPGEVVRFFITNAAAVRPFNLSIPGAHLKVVASDVGPFQREEWVESVVIAPAERYVVDVLFADAGDYALVNRVQAVDHLGGSIFLEEDTLGVVQVQGRVAAPGPTAAFGELRLHESVDQEIREALQGLEALERKELHLELETQNLPFPLTPLLQMEAGWSPGVEWAGTMPDMDWLATGREVRWILRDAATGAENQEIQWRFARGDRAVLRVVNTATTLHPMQHPIHIHGQRFLVLSRNGVEVKNRAWKDTVLVPTGGVVELLVELSNPGNWMLHCHISEHLESGMMLHFTVDDRGPGNG